MKFLSKKPVVFTFLLFFPIAGMVVHGAAPHSSGGEASSGNNSETDLLPDKAQGCPVHKGRPTDNPAKEKALPNVSDKAVPVIINLPWKNFEPASPCGKNPPALGHVKRRGKGHHKDKGEGHDKWGPKEG